MRRRKLLLWGIGKIVCVFECVWRGYMLDVNKTVVYDV